MAPFCRFQIGPYYIMSVLRVARQALFLMALAVSRLSRHASDSLPRDCFQSALLTKSDFSSTRTTVHQEPHQVTIDNILYKVRSCFKIHRKIISCSHLRCLGYIQTDFRRFVLQHFFYSKIITFNSRNGYSLHPTIVTKYKV